MQYLIRNDLWNDKKANKIRQVFVHPEKEQ